MLFQPGEIYKRILVPQSGKDFIQQITGSDFQAGSVDTGVTAEVFILQHISVNRQPDTVFCIVHQPQNTDGTGGDVEKLFHKFSRCKGQSGAAHLFGENGCFELFFTRRQQKVKICLLGIAQEQVFTDTDLQQSLDFMADLDGICGT